MGNMRSIYIAKNVWNFVRCGIIVKTKSVLMPSGNHKHVGILNFAVRWLSFDVHMICHICLGDLTI